MIMHPIETGKGLWRFVTNGPYQNAIDYGLGLAEKYKDLPAPVAENAMKANMFTDFMLMLSPLKKAFTSPKVPIPEAPVGLGELKGPAIEIGSGEGLLLNYKQGLASRKNSMFSNVITGSIDDAATKYLWTIDERGINVALEQTPAATRRGFITHTNISSKAFSGGEAWFLGNNKVYINPKSARFGGQNFKQETYQAAINYWEKLGYEVEAMELKTNTSQK